LKRVPLAWLCKCTPHSAYSNQVGGHQQSLSETPSDLGRLKESADMQAKAIRQLQQCLDTGIGNLSFDLGKHCSVDTSLKSQSLLSQSDLLSVPLEVVGQCCPHIVHRGVDIL